MHCPSIFNHGPVTGVSGSRHAFHLSADSSYLIDHGSLRGVDTPSTGVVGRNARYVGFLLGTVRALIARPYRSRCSSSYSLVAGFKGAILCCVPSANKLLPIVDSPCASRFTAYQELRGFRAQEALKHIQCGLGPLAFKQLLTGDHCVWFNNRRVRLAQQLALRVMGCV